MLRVIHAYLALRADAMLLLAVTLLSCRLLPATPLKHIDMPYFVAAEVAVTMMQQERMKINPGKVDLGLFRH